VIGSSESPAPQDNALQTLRDYVRRTGEMADFYVRSQPPDAGAAACALEWMDAWAFNEGLLGEVSRPLGMAARDRAVVGLAIAYLKLRDEPTLAAEKKDLVEAWLAAVVTSRAGQRGQPPGAAATDERAYWSALALMAAGVAAGERAPFDSGVESVRRGLADVASDGTLAWALRRGPAALHAHAAAMTPLVMAAELGIANGVDLYVERDGALQLVARRVIDGLDDPGYFARAAGAAQSPADSLGPAELAWMEPYYARFRDAKLPRWIARNRPLKNPDLGGDMTLAFGVRNFFAAR
jgi:poly(beta-D-mannuronate) lyase